MFTKIDFEEEAEGMVEYAQAAAMDSLAIWEILMAAHEADPDGVKAIFRNLVQMDSIQATSNVAIGDYVDTPVELKELLLVIGNGIKARAARKWAQDQLDWAESKEVGDDES